LSMADYVLDTNVVAELFKPRPSSDVIHFIEHIGNAYLSVAVFSELLFGAEKDRDVIRRARLLSYINGLRSQYADRIVPINLEIAESAGELRAFEAKQGRILSPMDSFMAATAHALNAILVTRNTKDFKNLNIGILNPFLDQNI